MQGVIVGVKAVLESRSEKDKGKEEERKMLMECLAELYVPFPIPFPLFINGRTTRYISTRLPGSALPYLLALRKPYTLQFIRDNNLFMDVVDLAGTLVEVDGDGAIELMVENALSVPVSWVFLFLKVDDEW